jgi:hypothetical protein
MNTFSNNPTNPTPTPETTRVSTGVSPVVAAAFLAGIVYIWGEAAFRLPLHLQCELRCALGALARPRGGYRRHVADDQRGGASHVLPVRLRVLPWSAGARLDHVLDGPADRLMVSRGWSIVRQHQV